MASSTHVGSRPAISVLFEKAIVGVAAIKFPRPQRTEKDWTPSFSVFVQTPSSSIAEVNPLTSLAGRVTSLIGGVRTMYGRRAPAGKSATDPAATSNASFQSSAVTP